MKQEKLDHGEADCGMRSGRPTPGHCLAGVEPLKPAAWEPVLEVCCG